MARLSHDVAGHAHRRNELWLAKLLAQRAHVLLDDVAVASEVIAPDRQQNGLLRQDLTRMAQKILEQVELSGGQAEVSRSTLGLVQVQVKRQIGECQAARWRLASTEARVNASDKLLEGER